MPPTAPSLAGLLLAASLLLLCSSGASAFRTEPKETDVALSPTDLQGPFRAIGKVLTTHGGATRRGTGFFVGACHVLINAHAVYMPEERPRLFEFESNGRAIKSVIAGASENFRAEVNHALKDKRSGRSITMLVVRNADGTLDPAQAVQVEEVLWLDTSADSDIALARMNRCLGIPEAIGHIKLLPRSEVKSHFDSCKGKNSPLLSAGYPGDQSGDDLRVNSSTWWRTHTEDSFAHKISNGGGSSGSPVFCAFYTTHNGEQRPVDRDNLRKPEERTQIYKSLQYSLLGINIFENSLVELNYARLLNDSTTAARIARDFKLNASTLQRRIEEVRREWAARSR